MIMALGALHLLAKERSRSGGGHLAGVVLLLVKKPYGAAFFRSLRSPDDQILPDLVPRTVCFECPTKIREEVLFAFPATLPFAKSASKERGIEHLGEVAG